MFEFLVKRMYSILSVAMLLPAMTLSIMHLADCRPPFTGYYITWYASMVLSAIPFFFGLRLLHGQRKSTKAVGIVIMTAAGLSMAYCVYIILFYFKQQAI